MNHLGTFKPLNIALGGNKIQHPTPRHSNTISQNVEGMHKEFTVFHKNLKNLVMLYTTRHQLMDSLNENGLNTAKCYNEMLDGTPLTSIVVPREKNQIGEKAKPIAAANFYENARPFEEGEFVGNRTLPSNNFPERLSYIGHDDGIETTEYPDYGVIQERLEPEEGSRIVKQLSKNNPSQEPEGLKASKMMSMHALNAPHQATESNGMKDASTGETGVKNEPPSARSLVLGDSITAGANYERRESADPPSRKAFPDDETGINVDKNSNWENGNSANSMTVDDMGGSFNIIVDDDEDSFTNGQFSQEKHTLIDGRKKERKDFADDFEHDKPVKEKLVTEKEIRDKEILNKYISKEEAKKLPYSPLISNSGTENGSLSSYEDTPSTEIFNDDEEKGKDDNGYLNISNDGKLLVMKGSPRPEPKSQPASSSKSSVIDYSYFDIHKAEYKETNSMLVEHSQLVQYVDEWMKTVSTRVQSRYFEYGKHRNSLNHYTSKVNSLLGEEKKLKEKKKPVKSKQIEKLERNQIKLTGARKTHDNAGESLLMLMDEVILRSWRDAFPLMKKSIGFECDFAKIKDVAKLRRLIELLDIIGEKESISMDARLELIRSKNPEDFYTGSRD